MKASTRVLVGVTGASGSLLAQILLARLARMDGVITHCVFTRTGLAVWAHELDAPPPNEGPRLRIYDNGDLFAPLASGSFEWQAMIIAPCSMSTVGKLASGLADSLLLRAADVSLKEGRPLVLAPRETPLSAIHLGNLQTLAQAGAIIMPPVLTMYHRPTSLEAMTQDLVEHILQRAGLPAQRQEWTGPPQKTEML